MTEPLTWQTQDVIAARVARIQIASDYYTDAGSIIDRKQVVLDENAAFPRLCVFEDSYTPTATREEAGTTTQVVVVEGSIKAGDDNDELLAHRLRADIGRALLGLSTRDFAGLKYGAVTGAQIIGDRSITRRPEGMELLVVQARVTLACVERATP